MLKKTHREGDTFHISLHEEGGKRLLHLEMEKESKKFIRCCMKFPSKIEFHMPMLLSPRTFTVQT